MDSVSGADKVLRLSVAACCLAACSIALVILSAWAIGWWQMETWTTAHVPMAPTTAGAILLLGANLLLRQWRPSSRAAWWSACAALLAVGGTSLAVLAQCFLRLDLPFLNWKVSASSQFGVLLGRMSPLSACLLAMLALAFFLETASLLPRRSWPRVASLLAMTCLGISLAVVLSYAIGLPMLYGSGYIPMALSTAISILLLSLGLMLASESTFALVERFRIGWQAPLHPRMRRFSFDVTIVFLGLLIMAGLIGLFLFVNRIHDLKETALNELTAVADLRSDQIAGWYEERLADAKVILGNPIIRSQALTLLKEPGNGLAQADLSTWAESLEREYGYVVTLHATDGRICLSGRKVSTSDSSRDQAFHDALHSPDVLFQDLHIPEETPVPDAKSIRLSLWVPIRSSDDLSQPAEGVWELQIDPERSLYPIIREWPIPSRTAETLLVRREGDEVLYLNELRHRKDTALKLRLPIDPQSHLIAATAALGQSGPFEGVDYRSVPVMAVTRHVARLPWIMVAKIDLNELYAPLRSYALLAGAAMVVLLLGTAVGIGLLGRKRENAWLQHELEVERECHALAERVVLLNKYANDVILFADKDWNITEANDRALDVYGYSIDELKVMKVTDLYAPADHAEQNAYALSEQSGATVERIHQRKDRSTFIAESSIHSIDVNGEPLRQVVVRDITDRKQAEQALIDREEDLAAVCENVPVLTLLVDSERRVRQMNATALEFSRMETHEMVGLCCGEALRCFYAVTTPEGCGLGSFCSECVLRRATLNTLTTGERRHHVEISLPVINADGNRETACFLLSTTMLMLRKRPMALISLMDITERVQAEKERIQLQTGIEQAAEAIMVADVSGAIRYLNPAVETVTGYSRTELMGEDWHMLLREMDDVTIRRDIAVRLGLGEAWKGHATNRRKDGSAYEAEITVSPVRDATGNIAHCVMVFRDVTRESELEARLLQAQKLEAIGTLAGGIAHDFNNILQALLGYADLVEAEVEALPTAALYIREIQTAGQRASDLVGHILAFSRRTERQLRRVEVQKIVGEALKLLRGSLPSTIDIVHRLEGVCPPVMADPMQIHQLVMNLCTNAYHAMRDTGGVLEVTLDTVDLGGDALPQEQGLEPGRYVKLTVKDTGCGMEAEVLERIFDPYFTTKAEGEGTGLGLATVHGIVKSHHGAITVQSRVRHGTEFVILLPLAPETKEANESPQEHQPPEKGSERVLFVDDEVAIAHSGKRALESLGYRVTVCANGAEALEMFLGHPNDFDVIVTDQTMPRLTGVELATAVLRMRPRLPIILCTGYSEQVDENGARALGIRQFIMKPVTCEVLAHGIREALESTGLPASF